MTIHNLPYSSKLNIQALSQLFNNTSECYKFFWFQAILNCLQKKDAGSRISFDCLINEMIVNAWYMVNECHLNLGPVDNLERAVKYLHPISELRPNDSLEKKRAFIENCNDKAFIDYKKELIKNVPFRLQAPFMTDLKGAAWHVGVKKLIDQINSYDGLIYKFEGYDGLDTCIRIEDEWLYYLKDHNTIISDWIKYNLIAYLERRNPGQPGIINKLEPPAHRDLAKIKDFWKAISNHIQIYEIYRNEPLDATAMSIDHFVPFSYVSHDEFWNLSPTTKCINSSKSNYLPVWNDYFPTFCKLHYKAYKLKREYSDVRAAFDKCIDKHFNDSDARMLWEREDLSSDQFEADLRNIIEPIYTAAERSKFEIWNNKVNVTYEIPELTLQVAEEREEYSPKS